MNENPQFLQLYKKRVARRGLNNRQRIERYGELNFEKFLSRAPNKREVNLIPINGQNSRKIDVVIQTKKQDEFETVFYFLARKAEECPIGHYFSLVETTIPQKADPTNYFIVVEKSNDAIDTYNRYVAVKANTLLQWYTKADGERHWAPAFAVGPKDNIIRDVFKRYRTHIYPVQSVTLQILIPFDSTINEDTQFKLMNTHWEVENIDEFSAPGTMWLSCIEISGNKDAIDGNFMEINKANERKINVLQSQYFFAAPEVSIACWITENGAINKENAFTIKDDNGNILTHIYNFPILTVNRGSSDSINIFYQGNYKESVKIQSVITPSPQKYFILSNEKKNNQSQYYGVVVDHRENGDALANVTKAKLNLAFDRRYGKIEIYDNNVIFVHSEKTFAVPPDILINDIGIGEWV